jgi:hypothetical protein
MEFVNILGVIAGVALVTMVPTIRERLNKRVRNSVAKASMDLLRDTSSLPPTSQTHTHKVA